MDDSCLLSDIDELFHFLSFVDLFEIRARALCVWCDCPWDLWSKTFQSVHFKRDLRTWKGHEKITSTADLTNSKRECEYIIVQQPDCVCVPFAVIKARLQVSHCCSQCHVQQANKHTHTLKTSNIGVFLHLLALMSQGLIVIKTYRFQLFSPFVIRSN